jgi:[ribosomal protein S18]-alanine N-acetyltransferase
MDIKIRRAGAQDAPGILACLATAFEPYRSQYTPDAYSDTVLSPGTLGDRMRSMSLFVAVDETGQVVGTIGCQVVSADEGHLRGMAVLPDQQGRGVAAQLLEAAETELRSRNCKQITLDTTEPLRRAMRFYENSGYARTGRISDFFGMPLIEYVKDL